MTLNDAMDRFRVPMRGDSRSEFLTSAFQNIAALTIDSLPPDVRELAKAIEALEVAHSWVMKACQKVM